MFSSSYVIITDRAINAPGRGKNFVDGLNATGKRYLKGKMEHMGKLSSKDTTNIGMLPSAPNVSTLTFQTSFFMLSIINKY